MKIGFRIVLPALILFAACNKDKFTTDPQVTVKSISPGEVNQGNIIDLEAKFTDKEGDLDSALIVYKWYEGDSATVIDTLRYSVESLNLPKKTPKGDISVQFEYGSNNTGYLPFPSVSKDTTSTFGLLLIDRASHRSNYSESSKIRLKKT
ncbi:MAG: hypothetical protein ABUT20_29290 [Bacteroidota bacterium]